MSYLLAFGVVVAAIGLALIFLFWLWMLIYLVIWGWPS